MSSAGAQRHGPSTKGVEFALCLRESCGRRGVGLLERDVATEDRFEVVVAHRVRPAPMLHLICAHRSQVLLRLQHGQRQIDLVLEQRANPVTMRPNQQARLGLRAALHGQTTIRGQAERDAMLRRGDARVSRWSFVALVEDLV